MDDFQFFDPDGLVKGLSSVKPMGSNQTNFRLVSAVRYERFFGESDQQRFFDVAISLLARAEQNLCVRHLIGCLTPIAYAMKDGEIWASFIAHNRSAIRLYQRPFLSALASWLSAPRSKEECKNLWGHGDASEEMDSRRCMEVGCNLKDPFVALLHDIGSRDPYEPRYMADTAFHILSTTLFSAAEEIKTTKTARRVKKVLNTAGLAEPWPVSMSDLLGGYTVDEFFQQMETWIDAWPVCSYPFCMFGSLAIVYPHHFLARIAQSTLIPMHTITLLSILDKLSRINRKSGEYLLNELASTLRLYDSLLNDLSRPLLINFISGDEIADVLTVTCSQLLQEVPRMLAKEGQGRFPGWLEGKADACTKTLLRLGSTVHACMEMADDPFEDKLDSRILDLSHAKRERASGAIAGAFDAFCSLAERQRCFAPGCMGTAAVAVLQKCSKCKRVLYCSTTCQREAWKHQAAPHKDLCKHAALLADHTGVSSRPQPSELDSFYQRVDGNEDMEKVAKEFRECFENLVNALV
ncbi:MYND-type domain-containing protein [Mycena venus]|uniref:MYND-type domain-containing protein n=1 Tax=Mycena venus TaxID=2733690 RepID=A0A8H6XCA2_9AGAR|nr:MYND-type domain-containing protein [Mycena venus]